MRFNYGKSDFVYKFIVTFSMLIIGILCVYPIIYVFSMSISNPTLVARHTLFLWPIGFSTLAYSEVLKNPNVWTGYYNTIWYTVVGTTISVSLTIMLAYALSRKEFAAKNVIMFFIAFTMLFSGGLIPLYILVTKLGLYNSRWAIILPSAISAWNTIIAKSFFQDFPNSLWESAKLDGANDITILMKIIIPMSKAIIAVLTIFYAIGQWNSFLPALIYLTNSKLHPLQIFLMKILISNELTSDSVVEASLDKFFVRQQIKYAVIIVSVLPIMTIYPFFQKHFAKGVMLGAIKG